MSGRIQKYTHDSSLAREFRTNIRSINSLVALVSFKTRQPEVTAAAARDQGH